MAKITPSERGKRAEVRVKTKNAVDKSPSGHSWWKARSKSEMLNQLIDTAAFLKEQQQFRMRQASVHARMYGNLPLMGIAGTSFSRMSQLNNLPIDRPTMNVVQSCVDTLVSRISQSRPRPVFLTDNGDYRSRNLAKQLNQFVGGELFATKAYELAQQVLRDASVLGSGCLHVFEDKGTKRVAIERVLCTELYVDGNDALYGMPRCMYRFKLVDRDVLAEMNPEQRSKVTAAQQSFPDSSDNGRTMSDQVMVVEAWHLPSGPDAGDGVHILACDSGILHEEPYERPDFPFVFIHYSPRMVGFWAQGLAEQLTGTQIEINKLLVTISKSISLVGVPRVFIEDGSKVVKAHLNDQIGSIVTYRGTKPSYEVAPCVPAELYSQLQRLIEYAYQQSGVSALAATSQKPAGLNSGEAIRNYDDLQSDRFATLNKRYDQVFVELAYKITDQACRIAKRDGSYSTVYPNKDGTREVDLPATKLLDDPYIIQCFDSSSLPRDPAGRMAKVTEMMQAGILSPQEGRRLLDFPDLQQEEKLANAAEERILKILDNIVEKGEAGFEAPDAFTDLQLALKLVTQYYNLYAAAGLEESKCALLRDYHAQVLQLQLAAQPSMPSAPMDGSAPIATPEAPPTSSLLPVA